MKFGLKIPLINGFYMPNLTDSENHIIDLSATLTNVIHAASFLYKMNDGSTISSNKYSEGEFTPVNIAIFPNPPAVVNPSAYSIVTV